jgi:exocyst complex component 5
MLKPLWISEVFAELTNPFSALEKAKLQDPKGEPDFSYLQNVKVAVAITHLLSAYINTALIPLASSSLTVRREMVNYSSTNISNLEKKVNSIFQITHDSMSLECLFLMLSYCKYNNLSAFKTEEERFPTSR